jgi:hypothetical protein
LAGTVAARRADLKPGRNGWKLEMEAVETHALLAGLQDKGESDPDCRLSWIRASLKSLQSLRERL